MPVTTPSVVVMILDDVGVTENALLPSLFGPNGLASQGASFAQAYSWPICSPTRLAMLLGRYPRREGIGDLTMTAMSANGDTLKLCTNTLAEAFAPSWATGEFGKWHLGRAPVDTGELMGLSALQEARIQAPLGPLVHGFEFEAAQIPDVPSSGLQADGFYKWWRGERGRLQLELNNTYATDAVEDAFLSWWSTETSPRFAWIGWPNAHDSGPGLFEIPPGGTDQPTVRGDYEECVRYLDIQIAAALASINLANTYVVVVSDNGTPDEARPLGTPSGYWKFTTFQGGVHVPLVIAGPGIADGIVSNRLVSVADLPATIAEIAGVVLGPGFDDSLSFANTLGGWVGTPPRSFVFSERYSATYDDQAVLECPSLIGMIQVQLKLRRVDPDGAGPEPSADLVYDILGDPGEQHPQAPSTLPPQIRNRLLGELASLPVRQ